MRFKTRTEVITQCAALGLQYRVNAYDTGRADYVVVSSDFKHAHSMAAYNPRTGKFHGVTDFGLPFSSDSECFHGKGWFETLCDFFWVR